mmetsp:Transcript_9734/g.27836  ORF Transcript_9734/g.27836 Transcript_9734/m.27836 type:complete len:293 (+) Transcript_9734:1029-1907(+)
MRVIECRWVSWLHFDGTPVLHHGDPLAPLASPTPGLLGPGIQAKVDPGHEDAPKLPRMDSEQHHGARRQEHQLIFGRGLVVENAVHTALGRSEDRHKGPNVWAVGNLRHHLPMGPQQVRLVLAELVNCVKAACPGSIDLAVLDFCQGSHHQAIGQEVGVLDVPGGWLVLVNLPPPNRSAGLQHHRDLRGAAASCFANLVVRNASQDCEEQEPADAPGEAWDADCLIQRLQEAHVLGVFVLGVPLLRASRVPKQLIALACHRVAVGAQASSGASDRKEKQEIVEENSASSRLV